MLVICDSILHTFKFLVRLNQILALILVQIFLPCLSPILLETHINQLKLLLLGFSIPLLLLACLVLVLSGLSRHHKVVLYIFVALN